MQILKFYLISFLTVAGAIGDIERIAAASEKV
jgi:hypothetical protein